MHHILVIEDEQSIADTIVHSIEREGYAATWHTRGATGLAALQGGTFALVVLDVGLPDVNGFELCKAIRAFSTVPIIFLTARDDEIDKIVGLELGGDDYMTKPFSPRELGARIKTVLRRIAPPIPGVAAIADSPLPQASHTGQVPHAPGALRIDHAKLRAMYHSTPLELTRYEFKLLALLASHPGRVYSRESLMQQVWDDDSPSLDRTVDAHIKSLRAKFREINPEVDPIITHRGTGYALREQL